MRLKDKVAVVTGTASGIGRATAILFASEGASVVCVDCNAQGNEKTCRLIQAKGGQASCFTADVADEGDVIRMAQFCERFGKVDVLFNNAGVVHWATVEECSRQDWEWVLRVNLTGPFLCTKHLLPLLKKSGAASVIHNGSVDGLYGNPRIPAYSASKGGLVPLTHVMAQEFAKYRIRVNCVAPAGIATGITPPDPGLKGELVKNTPLGRLGTSGEVATAALFLASDEASYITGAILVIDGGRTGLTPGTI